MNATNARSRFRTPAASLPAARGRRPGPASARLRLRLRCATALAPALPLLAVLAASAPASGQEETVGTVVGLVYDSTASAPLASARVAILGTSAMAETGPDGQFRLEGVPAGERVVSFFHPRLGALGVNGSQQRILVSDRTVAEVYLSVPSRATILGAWCSGEPGAGDTSVGGVVTDALTGVPLPGARVAVLGEPTGVLRRPRVLVESVAEDAGDYRLCNLEMGSGITIQAVFGSNRALPVEVVRRGPQVLDLVISISEPVSIAGTVHDWATEAPLIGAQVRLAGTEYLTFTDTAGQFGFVGVPPGRQVVQTEMLGYAPRVDSLTVFSREALGLEIALSTEAIVLEPLVVTGRRRDLVLTTPGTRFSGLTEAQVDSIAPRVFDFATLARAARTPGVTITERYMSDAFGNPRMGVCVEMARARAGGNSNACNMVDVRINDAPAGSDAAFFLLEVNPQDIKSIQFISPLEAGLLYGQRGANGVLLIYTR